MHALFCILFAGFMLPVTARAEKNPFYGINQNWLWETDRTDKATDVAQLIEKIEMLNVGTVRLSIRWAEVFDAPGRPSTSAYANYERVLRALPGDIKILATLDTWPAWHNIDKDPGAFTQNLRLYTAETVKRLGKYVDYWMVWSEPNNSDFSLSMANGQMWTAADYVNYVFLPAARTIKDLDPGACVILGAPAFNGVYGHRDVPAGPSKDWSNPQQPNYHWHIRPDWTQGVYDALKGKERLYDGVGVQPYYLRVPGAKALVLNPVEMVHGVRGTSAVMQRNGDRGVPIFWTEFGENIRDAELSSPELAAERLVKFYTQASVRRDTAVNPPECLIWYQLRHTGLGFDSPVHFGLLNRDNSFEPAFFAYRKLIFQAGAAVSLIEDFTQCPRLQGHEDYSLWSTTDATVFRSNGVMLNGGTLTARHPLDASEVFYITIEASGTLTVKLGDEALRLECHSRPVSRVWQNTSGCLPVPRLSGHAVVRRLKITNKVLPTAEEIGKFAPAKISVDLKVSK